MSETTDYTPVLPRAVREQVERANQLAREAGIANVPPPASPEPPPAAVGVEGTDESERPVTTEVTEPPQPEIVETLPEQFHPSTDPSAPAATPDWEARYNTLQGKYNSELPELRNQVRGLQELLASLNAQRHNYAGPEQPAGNAPGNGRDIPAAMPVYQRSAPPPIPPADIESYGEDLIRASQRWAEAQVTPRLAEYERRLAQIEGSNQQLHQLSSAQRVEAALDANIPNWRQVNVDPAFDEWLRQLDPFSGQLRKTLITDAYGGGDAPRTIAFFQAFLREQTAVSSPYPGTQPGQTGNGAMPVAPAATLPLDALAVPGRGQVAAPPASGAPGKRSWTGAEITAFYDQLRRGLWRGREAEFAAIERDMLTAQAEGRFRQ